MFFRRKRKTNIIPKTNPVSSALVHQLSNKEMQRLDNDGIICVSATHNIKLKIKEDNVMVEKLEAYRAELEVKKNTLLTKGIDIAAIEAEITAYRNKLTEEATKQLNDEVATIDCNIKCINELIARETEAANTIEATPITNGVTV